MTPVAQLKSVNAVCDTCGQADVPLVRLPVRYKKDGLDAMRAVFDPERPFVCLSCLTKSVEHFN